jgi:hypothetical protein
MNTTFALTETLTTNFIQIIDIEKVINASINQLFNSKKL